MSELDLLYLYYFNLYYFVDNPLLFIIFIVVDCSVFVFILYLLFKKIFRKKSVSVEKSDNQEKVNIKKRIKEIKNNYRSDEK